MPGSIEFLGYVPFELGQTLPEQPKTYWKIRGLSRTRLAISSASTMARSGGGRTDSVSRRVSMLGESEYWLAAHLGSSIRTISARDLRITIAEPPTAAPSMKAQLTRCSPDYADMNGQRATRPDMLSLRPHQVLEGPVIS